MTDEQHNILENIAHGGLTSSLGFDCAHIGDYYTHDVNYVNTLFLNSHNEPIRKFRDHDYVLNNIHQMIDAIVE